MVWFGKRKGRHVSEKEDITSRFEAGSAEPFKAAVLRTDPTEVNGVRIAGHVQEGGRQFTGLHSLPDLRAAVEKVGGGGKYKSTLYEDKDEGANLYGSYSFELPGTPLIKGKPIVAQDERLTKRKPGVDDPPPEVIERQKQLKIEEADLDLERVRSKKEREIRQMKKQTEEEDAPPAPTVDMQSALAPLYERMDQMQQSMEQERRDAAEKSEREALERKIESMEARLADGGGQGNTLGTMLQLMSSQTQAMMAASSENAKVIAEQNTKMFELISNKTDNATKAMIDASKRANDEKSRMLDSQFDSMRRSFDAGLAAGQGKPLDDESPKDVAGIVNQNIGKAIDMFGTWMMQRSENTQGAPPSREEIARASAEIVEKLKLEQKAQIEKSSQSLVKRDQAAPPAAPPPTQKKPALSPARVRRAMDRLLRMTIRDAKAGNASPEKFRSDATRELPGQVMGEIYAAFEKHGAEGVVAIMKKYGTPELVDEAYRVALSQEEPEPAEQPAEQAAEQPAEQAAEQETNES